MEVATNGGSPKWLVYKGKHLFFHMDDLGNDCSPRSSIWIGISTRNHPFRGTPMSGNLHILQCGSMWFKSGKKHEQSWNICSHQLFCNSNETWVHFDSQLGATHCFNTWAIRTTVDHQDRTGWDRRHGWPAIHHGLILDDLESTKIC